MSTPSSEGEANKAVINEGLTLLPIHMNKSYPFSIKNTPSLKWERGRNEGRGGKVWYNDVKKTPSLTRESGWKGG